MGAGSGDVGKVGAVNHAHQGDDGGPSLRAQRGNPFVLTQSRGWIAAAFGLAMTGGDGVAIALLSLLPGEILPPSLFIWWDKAQHALAFAVLSVLGQFAYMMERRLVLFGLMV